MCTNTHAQSLTFIYNAYTHTMHTHIQYAYACAYTYVFVFADLKKSSSRIKKLVNDLRRGARQGLLLAYAPIGPQATARVDRVEGLMCERRAKNYNFNGVTENLGLRYVVGRADPECMPTRL